MKSKKRAITNQMRNFIVDESARLIYSLLLSIKKFGVGDRIWKQIRTSSVDDAYIRNIRSLSPGVICMTFRYSGCDHYMIHRITRDSYSVTYFDNNLCDISTSKPYDEENIYDLVERGEFGSVEEMIATLSSMFDCNVVRN